VSPGKDARDYTCGLLSYDGHDGTDIRLPSLAVMLKGVHVLAAAPGKVRAIRDGMDDVSLRDADPLSIKGREAGNAVVLEHGDSWETQYSHLLKGSVKVRPGQRVQAGEALGMIGLSGKTEFPHVHFEVRHDGIPLDPFTGLQLGAQCGARAAPLWDAVTLDKLRYQASGILASGFAKDRPLPSDARLGEYEKSVYHDPPMIAYWVDVFGVQAGDEEEIRIVSEDGEVLVATKRVLQRNRAQHFAYVGKLKRGRWPAMPVRGFYILYRDGKKLLENSAVATFQ
jgi:hypothetical protein